MPVELVPLDESTSEIDDLFGPEPVQQPKIAAPKVELIPLPDQELDGDGRPIAQTREELDAQFEEWAHTGRTGVMPHIPSHLLDREPPTKYRSAIQEEKAGVLKSGGVPDVSSVETALPKSAAGIINDTIKEYTGEFTRAAAKAVPETIGTALKGFANLTTDDAVKVRQVTTDLGRVGQMSEEEFKRFDREIPLYAQINPFAARDYQRAARAYRAGDKAGGDVFLAQAQKNTNVGKLEEQQLYKAGEWMDGTVSGPEFKPKEGWEDGITVKLGQGGGSMLAFLPFGLLRAGSTPAMTMFGAGSGAGEATENARRILGGAGRDDRPGPYNAGYGEEAQSQVLRAGRLGVNPGVTDVIPLEILLQRVPGMIPGLRQFANTETWNRFAKAAGQIAFQVATEGGQEAGQQYLQNLITQLTLKPEQELTEGMLENFLIGGAIGGGVQAPVSAYEALTPRPAPAGRPAPAPTLPPTGAAPPPPGTKQGQGFTVKDTEPSVEDVEAVQKATRAQKVRVPDRREAAKIMRDAGYTPEDVLGMTPEQLSVTLQELIEQGGRPDVGSRETKLPDQDVPEVRRPQAAGQEVVQPLPGEPQQPVATADRGPQGTAPVETPSPAQPTVELVPLDTAAVVGEGTRAKPVRPEIEGDLAGARERIAEPTPAQAVAENYRSAHVKLHGLDITIETPRGKTRRGYDAAGNQTWQSPPLSADYGRIKRTTAKDGDAVDVYIGPNPGSRKAFVVDQRDPKTGRYDEAKVIIGADDLLQATSIYDGGFSDGSGASRRRSITETDIDGLRDWIKNGDTKRPFKTQRNFYAATPGAERLEENAPAVRRSEQPGLPDLRREGDRGLPGVGRLQDVSEGYGAAPSGDDNRPQEQQSGLQPGELPLGNGPTAVPEQAGLRPPGDVSGENANDRGMGSRDEGAGANDLQSPQHGATSRKGSVQGEAPARIPSPLADVPGEDATAQDLGARGRAQGDDASGASQARVDDREGSDDAPRPIVTRHKSQSGRSNFDFGVNEQPNGKFSHFYKFEVGGQSSTQGRSYKEFDTREEAIADAIKIGVDHYSDAQTRDMPDPARRQAGKLLDELKSLAPDKKASALAAKRVKVLERLMECVSA